MFGFSSSNSIWTHMEVPVDGLLAFCLHPAVLVTSGLICFVRRSKRLRVVWEFLSRAALAVLVVAAAGLILRAYQSMEAMLELVLQGWARAKVVVGSVPLPSVNAVVACIGAAQLLRSWIPSRTSHNSRPASQKQQQ
jgi:hypothetical protein